MKHNKTLNDIYAEQYIQEIFAERLIANGFMCPDGKSLCWYRRPNREILNSVIFYAPWAKPPIHLHIGYGIFPLFEEPVYTPSVHLARRFNGDERFVVQPIIENYPSNAMHYAPYSDDIGVLVPKHDGKGIYTFDNIILPRMDEIQSVEKAYAFHKMRRINHPLAYLNGPENRFGELSRTFIDMALWVDDSEMYPYAISRSASAVKLYEALCIKHPKNQEYKKELVLWQQLQSTLTNNARMDYLNILSQRVNSNISLLCSRYGMDL